MKYKIALLSLFTFTQIMPVKMKESVRAELLKEHTGQIFMFTRPVSNSIGINQATFNNFAYESPNLGANFQLYGIFADSFETDTAKQYFLFDFKDELSIRGGTNPSAFEVTPQGLRPENPGQDEITTKSFKRDILGQWLNQNEVETYSFTLEPRQRQGCAIIEYTQELKKLADYSIFDLWYLTIKLPVTYISNNIGFKGDCEALEAFAHNNFNYVNITTADLTLTRPTNLHIILGTNYLSEHDCQIMTGAGVIAPLTEQNTNRCLFEPIQGFNAHFAFSSQLLFQFPLVRRDDCANSRICFFLDIDNSFLMRRSQYRTYDLKCKPYSRYMKLLDMQTNETVPAMNALTIKSRVEPFNVFNMATGFRVKFNNMVAELGYELWAHGTEVLKLETEFEQDWIENRYGIAFINDEGQLAYVEPVTGQTLPLEPGQVGWTASESTINHVAAPDGTVNCCNDLIFTQKNKYIRQQDLDMQSAAARSSMVHRVFFTGGGSCRACGSCEAFGNIGVYMEVAHNNAALSMWGIWAKIGMAF